MPGALGGEGGAAPRAQPQQVTERGQELDGGLGGQRLDAAEVDLLLDQPVGREGEGEAEGDPRRVAVADGEDEHRRGADPDRGPLGGPQPFLQQQHAHRDGDQRVDEVAEGGLDDVPGVHGPDVDAPVDGDDRRGDRDQGEPARLSQQLAEPGPAAHDEQGGAHEEQGPDHPVGEDLHGARGLEERPEQRDEPPHPVRREAVQQSYAPLGGRLLGHGSSFVPARALLSRGAEPWTRDARRRR